MDIGVAAGKQRLPSVLRGRPLQCSGLLSGAVPVGAAACHWARPAGVTPPPYPGGGHALGRRGLGGGGSEATRVCVREWVVGLPDCGRTNSVTRMQTFYGLTQYKWDGPQTFFFVMAESIELRLFEIMV